MQIYVGNLPYSPTGEDLMRAFRAYGKVATARVILDRATGIPKGFGFVEMSEASQVQAAIKGLNGTQFMGRSVSVNEAKPRAYRNPGGKGR